MNKAAEHSGTDSDASDKRLEEPEDILAAFLGIVYNYAPITHAETGSLFSYTFSGSKSAENTDRENAGYQRTSNTISLTLRTPDTQARNWQLHASSIWVASVFLADHMEELGLENEILILEPSDRSRLEILELGAGAGLPGLLAAKCLERIDQDIRRSGKGVRNWTVTLSDYPDNLLIETLRKNVQQNGFDVEPSLGSHPAGPIRVVPYAWGEDISSFFSVDDKTEPRGFDLIIAADTLWNAALHETFARTLYRLLRRSSKARVHLVAGLHTGRYALVGFLRVVQSVHLSDDIGTARKCNRNEMGLEVLCISERGVNDNARREWCAEREGDDDAERRRWVVWITLGWTGL